MLTNHSTRPLSVRSNTMRATRYFLAGALVATASLAMTTSVLARSFENVREGQIAKTGDRLAAPEAFTTFRADLSRLEAELVTAPLARSSDLNPAPSLELPMPDGHFEAFRVYESPIMAPELAAKYPELRTYEVYGIDDRSAFGRVSITPQGFHGLIFKTEGWVWIDPYQKGDTQHYSVCYGRDYRRAEPVEGFVCHTEGADQPIPSLEEQVSNGGLRGSNSTGDFLRTYRTVVAATGEYTTYHGGTVAAGMAAIVVAMNRMNGVYQKEASIFMQLVANNDLVVYTNGGTDPYTNNNGGAMLGQNQSNLNAVIGNANYDMGHVFSTGGGGIASLGCICINARKAQGVTGLNAPTGDNFYIDYVAHEMGHQFGANHSFNGTLGSCSGGNRNAGTAYEPGSGTTIMSYAGICGGDNIQQHSDDYFHGASFSEIRNFTENLSGNTCPVTTATGNTPPVADAQFGTFSIPTSTPFLLEGGGFDDDGHLITYCWEQMDLGPAGPPNSPTGNAPLFRSFDPVEVSWRTFPKIQDVINNTQVKGEILPSYARNMRFRLTVRDGLGGVSYDTAPLIAVVNTGAPFLVTSPNVAGIEWAAGASQVVTWNVSGTNVAPISCANVNILLSTDGGYTYPTVLVSNTPNDGSQSIVVPSMETTTARVRVEAADNIFFDISNFNLTITSDPASGPDVTGRADGMLIGNQPNPFNPITHIRFRLEETSSAKLEVYAPSGRRVVTLADGVLEAGEYTRSWNGRDDDDRPVPAGVYFYRLQAGDKVESRQMVLTY